MLDTFALGLKLRVLGCALVLLAAAASVTLVLATGASGHHAPNPSGVDADDCYDDMLEEAEFNKGFDLVWVMGPGTVDMGGPHLFDRNQTTIDTMVDARCASADVSKGVISNRLFGETWIYGEKGRYSVKINNESGRDCIIRIRKRNLTQRLGKTFTCFPDNLPPSDKVAAAKSFDRSKCTVARVINGGVGKADDRLFAAGCLLEHIKRRFSSKAKKGKVLKQSPKPGMELPADSPVDVVLGKGPKRN